MVGWDGVVAFNSNAGMRETVERGQMEMGWEELRAGTECWGRRVWGGVRVRGLHAGRGVGGSVGGVLGGYAGGEMCRWRGWRVAMLSAASAVGWVDAGRAGDPRRRSSLGPHLVPFISYPPFALPRITPHLVPSAAGAPPSSPPSACCSLSGVTACPSAPPPSRAAAAPHSLSRALSGASLFAASAPPPSPARLRPLPPRPPLPSSIRAAAGAGSRRCATLSISRSLSVPSWPPPV